MRAISSAGAWGPVPAEDAFRRLARARGEEAAEPFQRRRAKRSGRDGSEIDLVVDFERGG